ncbi:MAG: acyl carrier protein [Phycisphaerae bacterium]
MDIERLMAMLVEVLNEVQRMSGRTIEEITEMDKPIGDLIGFDSLNGVETTVLLADRLQCDIPGDVNLFTSKDGRRALSVREVASRIQELLSAGRE